jgi:probable HAF family extracellular repeat protein
VSGGTIAIGSGDTLTFGNGTSDTGALISVTLSGGTVAVAAHEALTFATSHNVVASDAIYSSTVDNAGTIDVASGATLTLAGTEIDNSGGGTFAVDAGATLAVGVLKGSSGSLITLGATFIGGTIQNHGTIDVQTAAVVEIVAGSPTTVEVGSTATFEATVTNTGTIVADSLATVTFAAGATVTNDFGGTINANGGSITFDTGHTIENAGTLEATGGGTLVIEDEVDNTGGTITASGTNSTVQLSDATVERGRLVTGDPSGSDEGVIEIVATSGGMSVFYGNNIPPSAGTANALSIDGYVQVDASANLELTGTVYNDGTIAVATLGTLDLSLSSLIYGAITNNGTVDVVGSSAIYFGASIDGGQVTVESGQELGLDDGTVSGGTITLNSNATLFIEETDGVASTVGGTIENSGTVMVVSAATLSLSGATIEGGTITDDGTIDIVGSSEIENVSGLSGGGTLQVESQQTLTLSDDTVSNMTMVVGPPVYDGFTILDGNDAYLSGPPQSGTFAIEVNSFGQVVADSDDASNNSYGFVFNSAGSTFADIQDSNADYSGSGRGTNAYGINSSGDVSGSYIDSSGNVHGFVYNPNSGPSYTTIEVPGASGTVVDGINDSNTVAGVYFTNSGNYVFSENSSGSGFSSALLPDQNGDFVWAINNSSEVVGDYTDANNNSNAFVFENGTLTALVAPSAFYATSPPAPNASPTGTDAMAINNLGEVAGDYVDAQGNTHGFIYNPVGNSWTTIDDPLAVHGTVVDGINDLGEAVGYYYDASNNPQAFVYDDGVYITLDIEPGFRSAEAYGINDAGQIVGQFEDSSGSYYGFLTAPLTGASLDFTDGTTVSNSTLQIGVGDAATVESNSDLTFDGVVVDNQGTLTIASENTDDTALLISGDVILQGGGTVAMSAGSGSAVIEAVAGNFSGNELYNVDNTISGSGVIGADSGLLIDNEAGGTIEAVGGTLAISDDLINDGTLAAKNNGVLVVPDSTTVTGAGSVVIGGSSTAKFQEANFSENVMFIGLGTLALADAANYHATISGLTATAPATGDVIDLTSIPSGDIASTLIDGSTLYVNEVGGEYLSFNIAGNLEGNVFGVSADSNSDTNLTLETAPDAFWNNVDGGSWTNGADWSIGGGSTPSSSDVAYIGGLASGDSVDVTSAGATAYFLFLNASSATVIDGSGGTLLLTEGLSVGAGTFDMEGGTLQAGILDAAGAGSFIGYGTVEGPTDGSYAIAPTVDVTGTVTASNLASTGQALEFASAVTGTGTFVIDSGATLQFDSSVASGATVTFADTTGTLELAQTAAFHGVIGGFGSSDVIDLTDLSYSSDPSTEYLNWVQGTGSNSDSGMLTITDGTTTVSLTLDGSYTDNSFQLAPDGNTTPGTDISYNGVSVDPVVTPGTNDVSGDIAFADSDSASALSASFTPEGANYLGDFSLNQATVSDGNATVSWEFDFDNQQVTLAPGQTLTQSYNVTVADAQNPAANVTQPISVTIGGPGNDNLVFAPGIGADTITNFNPQQDTIELDHFANAQTVQELEALVTSDAHGDAVINLGHNDSITLPGVTDTQLQQVIQAGHVLLH